MTQPKPTDYLILLGLSVIWGSSYILIKKGLLVFSPAQVGALRLGIAALALAPLAVTHLRRIEWRQIPVLIAIGLTGTALPSMLFPLAQTKLSSSLTGMLSGLSPLCTLIVAFTFFAARDLGRRQVLGILLGLAGAVTLAAAAPGEAEKTTQLAYAGFIVLACFCYGTAPNLVANFFPKTSSLTITVVSFFLVGFPALIWALTAGAVWGTVVAHSAQNEGLWALGYVSILALVSTVTASIIFFRLIQRTGAVFASTVSYLIPLVALGWGVLVGEGLNWLQIPAIVLVLIGVFLSRGK